MLEYACKLYKEIHIFSEKELSFTLFELLIPLDPVPIGQYIIVRSKNDPVKILEIVQRTRKINVLINQKKKPSIKKEQINLDNYTLKVIDTIVHPTVSI